MNLPLINSLNLDGQSTYITFTKALVDFDKAITYGTPYVFSKMVALNLPEWKNPDFYINLNSMGVTSTSPNDVLPKLIQYYTENIIRQRVSSDSKELERMTEIAFWKSLNKCGLNYPEIKNIVTFVNDIVLSNFVNDDNNNGWGEIICQIPNKCKKLNLAWKTIVDVPNTIISQFDDGMFDTGNKEFTFTTEAKDSIDFQNISYDDTIQQKFKFNAILLFYIDSTGIHKLHGINFIHNFDNKVTYWDLPTFEQVTNSALSIGYQFKFNMKTCNNEASKLYIHNDITQIVYETFGDTMDSLNTFLKVQIRKEESGII